jgi:hypothetical protein
LQANSHFIAKRLTIHENDAFQAIFERAGATISRGPGTGPAFTGYNLRFCLRNTVYRSLKEREKPQVFRRSEKYWFSDSFSSLAESM